MNILIRKNFNAESGSRDRSHGKFGLRHRKSHHGGGVHGNRNRESVFCTAEDHCCSYRTHLFLNTSNQLTEYEEDSASITQAKSSFPLLQWAIGSIKRKSSTNKCDYLINQINDSSVTRKVRRLFSKLCAYFSHNCNRFVDLIRSVSKMKKISQM